MLLKKWIVQIYPKSMMIKRVAKMAWKQEKNEAGMYVILFTIHSKGITWKRAMERHYLVD